MRLVQHTALAGRDPNAADGGLKMRSFLGAIEAAQEPQNGDCIRKELGMLNKSLSVPNISCMHCAHHIKTVLGTLPGVKGVEVDVPKKLVQATYDSEATLSKIEAALAAMGYPVAQ
jgi:copper chaperone